MQFIWIKFFVDSICPFKKVYHYHTIIFKHCGHDLSNWWYLELLSRWEPYVFPLHIMLFCHSSLQCTGGYCMDWLENSLNVHGKCPGWLFTGLLSIFREPVTLTTSTCPFCFWGLIEMNQPGGCLSVFHHCFIQLVYQFWCYRMTWYTFIFSVPSAALKLSSPILYHGIWRSYPHCHHHIHTYLPGRKVFLCSPCLFDFINVISKELWTSNWQGTLKVTGSLCCTELYAIFDNPILNSTPLAIHPPETTFYRH